MTDTLIAVVVHVWVRVKMGKYPHDASHHSLTKDKGLISISKRNIHQMVKIHNEKIFPMLIESDEGSVILDSSKLEKYTKYNKYTHFRWR